MLTGTTDDRVEMVARRARAFLGAERPATPCLVIDLEHLERSYRELRAALPEAPIFYAVTACAEPAVLQLLVRLGSSFSAADLAEVERCLQAGAEPERVCYGSTIKKPADIARAHRSGITQFAFDSEPELRKIARAAPGASVVCRIRSTAAAGTPRSPKFGCAPDMAADMLVLAPGLGLDAAGVSFHVGSQQRTPQAWDPAIARAAGVFRATAARGVHLRRLNLGGGFPARCLDAVPAPAEYGAGIRAAVRRHFGATPPELLREPGRSIAGDAGVLRSEVVLVSRRGARDTDRWVFLDAGRFGGRAAGVTHRIATTDREASAGPVVLAGPTDHSPDGPRHELPLSLRAGDTLDFLSSGAYASASASAGCQSSAPLSTYCV